MKKDRIELVETFRTIITLIFYIMIWEGILKLLSFYYFGFKLAYNHGTILYEFYFYFNILIYIAYYIRIKKNNYSYELILKLAYLLMILIFYFLTTFKIFLLVGLISFISFVFSEIINIIIKKIDISVKILNYSNLFLIIILIVIYIIIFPIWSYILI